MKNILFFFLFAFSLQAQTTTKNFVLSGDGINYLEITRVTNEDGFSYSETAALVGPAAALAGDQADKVLRTMSELAAEAYTVSFTKRTISEATKADSVILAITAISPLKVIQDRNAALLLTPGWTIENGAIQTLVFTINAQGNLRYSVNGAATKSASIYGDVIRLRNYPSAPTDTDFYISENGRQYFNLPNREKKIKKP